MPPPSKRAKIPSPTPASPSASDTAEYDRHVGFLQRSFMSKKWSLASMLTKQTEKERSVLAKLFSSSSVSRRKRPMAMAESRNSECQRKKKSVVRPVTRDVIFFARRVPQKSLKMSLSEEGRMKSLVFKRTMTPLQVQNEIRHSFRSVCHDGPFLFLTVTKDLSIHQLFSSVETTFVAKGEPYIFTKTIG